MKKRDKYYKKMVKNKNNLNLQSKFKLKNEVGKCFD